MRDGVLSEAEEITKHYQVGDDQARVGMSKVVFPLLRVCSLLFLLVSLCVHTRLQVNTQTQRSVVYCLIRLALLCELFNARRIGCDMTIDMLTHENKGFR